MYRKYVIAIYSHQEEYHMAYKMLTCLNNSEENQWETKATRVRL